MTLKKNLGAQIRKLRKNRKYTQEQFAEMVGIDTKNISKIENGINYPSAQTLSAIAKALEVEEYELFLFKNKISYEIMRNTVIQAMDNKQNILYLYKIIND